MLIPPTPENNVSNWQTSHSMRQDLSTFNLLFMYYLVSLNYTCFAVNPQQNFLERLATLRQPVLSMKQENVTQRGHHCFGT